MMPRMLAQMTGCNGVSARKARAEDCDALTAMMLRSSAYDGDYRHIVENYPVTRQMIAKGEVWVFESEGAILGFYRLNRAAADLDLMFVDDAVQGRGIGRAIFEHMKAFAAESGLNEIQIVAHPPAASFYRRMGALDVGISRAETAGGWDRPILKLVVRQ